MVGTKSIFVLRCDILESSQAHYWTVTRAYFLAQSMAAGQGWSMLDRFIPNEFVNKAKAQRLPRCSLLTLADSKLSQSYLSMLGSAALAWAGLQ
jgi:hypothetical protein